jgi:peptidyl-prolyl cis-trans isomerase SurA
MSRPDSVASRLQCDADRRKNVGWFGRAKKAPFEGTHGVKIAMAAILQSWFHESCVGGSLSRWRRIGLATLLAGAATIGSAQAQNVVAFVNGEPITALDIEQRGKLNEASSPTHKAPSKQEVLDELINEKLEIKEAKRFGMTASDEDVDQAFATMAQRQQKTTEQFVQMLTKAGVAPQTFRARLRAQIVWPPLVRGRYSSSLEVADQDVLQQLLNKKSDGQDTGNVGNYDYTLRPILLMVTPGAPGSVFEERKRDAEALRSRFKSCDEGLPYARSLGNVVVRDQLVRSSSDINPVEKRKELDSVPVGQLTAPEVTRLGIEMFAVCAKDAAKNDNNSPDKKEAREAVFNEKYERLAKRYLEDLRRQAFITYPGGGPPK